MRSPSALALRLSLALLPSMLAAQAGGNVAGSYEERFQQLWELRARGRQAAVSGLTLTRDRATITLGEGILYLLEPIGGQTIGAVFRGRGRLAYTPGARIEQDRLRLFRSGTGYDEPFDELVLFVADSTVAELERQLTFTAGEAPGELSRRFQELLDYFGDKGERALDPDLLSPLLNGESTGLFLAMAINRANDPWMFLVNPAETEAVQLLTRARRTARARRVEAVTMDPPMHAPPRPATRGDRAPGARISQYTMQILLDQRATGDLAFSAVADLTIRADTAVGPWVPFYIYPEMQLDAAQWTDGTPAQVFLAKDNPYLWVHLGSRLAAGAERGLRLRYHGDLIERSGDWFFIKSSIAWYPLAMDNRAHARFDLTFTSPSGYLLASVGTRTDSTALPNHQVRTRWETPRPIRNASFNIGRFESFRLEEDSLPPVTVLWSEDMHKLFVQEMSRRLAYSVNGPIFLQARNMKEQVGGDIMNAMRFFTHVFGPPPVSSFHATEIPWSHGEAWPGVIGLSWFTFQQAKQFGLPEGFDQVFRAHEVAHQWWGISVDYATYRDRWLSEGISDFAGLWYLQTRRKDNARYFDMLDRWKASIMLRRGDPLPIWLGHRVVTANTGNDYSAIVYQKGAWVMHMLRILLLDLGTMSEDRFTAAMRRFYAAHTGGAASTADLQRAFEASTGQPMGWFFEQWVYGTGIPTYRVAWQAAEGGGAWQVRLRIRQEKVPDTFLAYVPVKVELANGQTARFRIKVTGAVTEVTLPPVPGKPKAVKFNDLEGVLAEVNGEGW